MTVDSREIDLAVKELKNTRAGQVLARYLAGRTRVEVMRALYKGEDEDSAAVQRGRAQALNELATLFGVSPTQPK